jgi:RNA polymerase sigma-70 factor (ECF subfamily)
MARRRTEFTDQFTEFFERDFVAVVNGVAFVLGDAELAQDAVTAAVAKAWTLVQRGETIDSLGAWTRTVALNSARSSFRRRARERHAYERWMAVMDPPATSTRSPGADAVEAALAQLPDRQREVVTLRYFHQLSVGEIAVELGLTEHGVRAALRRAQAALTGSLYGFAGRTRARGRRAG